MFKTILVAVDGSTGNERILLYADHVARVEHAQLLVVHAYDLPVVYEWTEGFQALKEHYEAIAGEVVKDAQEVLQSTGMPSAVEIRAGPAAEVILQAVAEYGVDLIVLGSRTQATRQPGESVLGSVSAQVLRSSSCPVLVVP